MAQERCWGECGGIRPAETPQGLCRQCLLKLDRSEAAKADQSDTSTDQGDIPTNITPPVGFVPPEPDELEKQFPQLEILELLGQGGMGVVYKARQRQLDRLVALKILPSRIARAETFAERFTREARSLARLSHPNIVMIYDFGHTESGLYYFIMEYVGGTDLRQVIQTGELSASEALNIVPQICEALQYAHEEGIVHRDIKPENILLNKKGQVRIADFGLAKLLDRPATGAASTLTKAGQQMGTPHYMSPEQIEHPSGVDHRADIYSLGVVFYEMLTGELPLGRFARPSEKAQVDVRLDNVVLRTLEKEPQRRYQSISEVKSDVEEISSGGPQTAPSLSEQIRRQIREKTGLNGLLDAGTSGGTRKLAIGSCALGIASLLFTTFNMSFAGEFMFIFLPSICAVFLGVTVIRAIRSYRGNRLDVGLAVGGILAGLISGIGLFTGMI